MLTEYIYTVDVHLGMHIHGATSTHIPSVSVHQNALPKWIVLTAFFALSKKETRLTCWYPKEVSPLQVNTLMSESTAPPSSLSPSMLKHNVKTNIYTRIIYIEIVQVSEFESSQLY